MSDCFPDAKVTGRDDSSVGLKKFWCRFVKWVISQLDAIEVLEPQNIRQMIKEKYALYKNINRG